MRKKTIASSRRPNGFAYPQRAAVLIKHVRHARCPAFKIISEIVAGRSTVLSLGSCRVNTRAIIINSRFSGDNGFQIRELGGSDPTSESESSREAGGFANPLASRRDKPIKQREYSACPGRCNVGGELPRGSQVTSLTPPLQPAGST